MTFIFAVRIYYEGATCRFKDRKLYNDSNILQKMIFPELIRTPLQSISAFAYLPAGHQRKCPEQEYWSIDNTSILCERILCFRARNRHLFMINFEGKYRSTELFVNSLISFAQKSELRLGGSRDSLEEEAFLKMTYTPTARTNSTLSEIYCVNKATALV